MKKILLLLSVLAIGFSVVSCGKRISKTYIDQQQPMLLPYYNENFTESLSRTDKFVQDVEKNYPQDYFVALLEQGKIAMDAGSWDLAIKKLQIAEKRFINIEGTISLSEEGSSIFLDDTTKEYEAEPLEKIMISPYLALAYLGKGDFNGARIERNRAMFKINEYIEKTEGAEYLENPFSRYISALIYEKEGKNQDAQIELKKIQKTKPFLKDFVTEELKELNGKSNGPKKDLVVFVDLGRSPIKFEKNHKARVGNVDVSAVYAEMRPRNYNVKKCKVLLDGNSIGETILLTPISPIVLEQYKKNEPKIIKAVVARMVAKGATQVVGQSLQKNDNSAVKAIGLAANLFGKVSSAIERADLRSWLTLPAEVQVLRARNLPEGIHTIELVYLNKSGSEIGKSAPKKVNIQNGEISFVHFRVVK